MTEIKHESDISPKDRRRLEWTKIKELKGKRKIEYLWSYYKGTLVIGIAAILVIVTGVTMYRNIRETPILTIAVIDADQEEPESFEALRLEILKVLDPKNKYSNVVIDTSGSSVNTDENMAKTTILMSTAGDTDVVVCNEDTYNRFNKEGIFADWGEILGNDYERYEPYMTDGVIDLSKSSKWCAGEYINYQPAYLCALKKSKHMKEIQILCKYFF